MSTAYEKPATIVPFAPSSKGHADATVDDSGNGIIALLQRAAEMAKEDCARAMDLAHKLASELRGSEARISQIEKELAYFRDRASRAEEWLLRIHNEVQNTFFPNEERKQSSDR